MLYCHARPIYLTNEDVAEPECEHFSSHICRFFSFVKAGQLGFVIESRLLAIIRSDTANAAADSIRR